MERVANIRRTIMGVRYDTEIAEALGTTAHGSGDDGWTETLYRTPRAGRLFLAGRGGRNTRWAALEPGNGFIASEGVKSLLPSEARHWAATYLGEEEAARLFP